VDGSKKFFPIIIGVDCYALNDGDKEYVRDSETSWRMPSYNPVLKVNEETIARQMCSSYQTRNLLVQ
jgi:hypothetical protein